jgi:hypothetical protein
MKKRRFDEGGDVDRKDFYSGFTVDKNYPDNKKKSTAKAAVKNFSDEKESGPKEDTSAVSGRADPMSKRMPSDEQKEKNAKELAKELATTMALGGAGKAVQTMGRVGAPSRVAGQTYAEKKAFLKQSEKEYNKLRGDLDAGVKKPEGFSNLYGKRNFTGKEATEANTKRFNEKGYAKGGSIRGGGCESKGKTKGRFV